jgi:hypothetical protein
MNGGATKETNRDHALGGVTDSEFRKWEDSFLELRFRSNIRLAGQEKVLLACLASNLRDRMTVHGRYTLL